MDALPFLAAVAKSKRQPVYVLAGDEDFLKRRCRDAIIHAALGDADAAFAVGTYAGDKLDFSTVRNELDTLPFLSPCRVVVVDAADTFVTAHRPALERYAAAPSAAGVLVLDVKAFPENTKLAKALPDAAKVHCKAPPAYKLGAWVQEWARAGHGKKLSPDAAALLIDLAGNTMGQLDQELEKLAVAAGAKSTIEAADVHRLVGRSQGADVFRILDAIGEGKPAAALTILERLFAEGVAPMGVLAPMMAQLRKLAAVGRLTADGQALGPAMDAAKVPAWPQARESFQRQVRWLGRRRLDALSGWLVEIDRDLKGGSPLPEKVQVERLVVRLARPRT
ncbi:DNA polymerase III subunit delta [Urbifossiella limnaea]|uniref:DNA polymerase III subunit delta n=1 Tax=Urbifossiella limnaea TaxID=2528023 RepID=A0A517Y319_9BACT|nr:DNA polymerase III subunit delta [Urbifossiella limnaea]QDU24064.1 DNA polymerase III subunit delta [Urbifossiella limnaea]